MIEGTAAFQRLGKAERLIVVHHHGDLAADALLDRAQRGKVLRQRRVTEPELDRAEATGQELLGFARHVVRGHHQAEPAGVVGGDAPGPAADQR